MPNKCFFNSLSNRIRFKRTCKSRDDWTRQNYQHFSHSKRWNHSEYQWLKNIPCTEEDNPQGKRYVFSLHFKDTDRNASTVCRDTNRKLKSLKKGAIPIVFITVPCSTYMKETWQKLREFLKINCSQFSTTQIDSRRLPGEKCPSLAEEPTNE